jgi:hypothetical protein
VRNICLVAVLVALPLAASAQERPRHGRDGGAPPPAQTPQQPGSIGSIGLPLPSIGLPPATKPSGSAPWNGQRQNAWWEKQGPPTWERQRPANGIYDIRQIPGWTQGNVAKAMIDQQRAQQQLEEQIRRGQVKPRQRGHNYQPSVVYVLPTYGYSGLPVTTTYETTPAQPAMPPPPEPPPAPAPEQRVPLGALRLEVEPRESLQIFVDGVFVGTPADVGDELEMVPGPHHIELRARGHKTQTFDVGIVEDKLITYRGALDRDPAAAPVAPVVRPATGRTMYVIPGCYMGNVSPKEMSLPKGCDISKLTTISP